MIDVLFIQQEAALLGLPVLLGLNPHLQREGSFGREHWLQARERSMTFVLHGKAWEGLQSTAPFAFGADGSALQRQVLAFAGTVAERFLIEFPITENLWPARVRFGVARLPGFLELSCVSEERKQEETGKEAHEGVFIRRNTPHSRAR